MRRIAILLFCLSLLAAAPAAAASRLAPFRIAARAGVLMDTTTGQVLFAQKPDKTIAPASFTKLMTLFLVFDAIKNGQVSLGDRVPISKKAWKTGGSKMFVRVGKRVRLEDLIKGIAVVSGNDACVAVAEYLMGDTAAFVGVMNEKAKELGLKHTRFGSVHGLPREGEQQTSALDMARLAQSYVAAHPDALFYHSMKSFTFSKITQRNRNGLLWLDMGVDGLKTGHLKDAGYHLLATAADDRTRLIAVVMGAKGFSSRENEALRLLNYGFRNFINLKVFDKGQVLGQARVYYGPKTRLEVRAAEDGLVSVPRRNEEKLTWETRLADRYFAPVPEGERLGIVRIKAAGETLKDVELLAAEEVPYAGLMMMLIHSAWLLFEDHPVLYWAAGFVLAGLLLLAVYVVLRFRKVKEG